MIPSGRLKELIEQSGYSYDTLGRLSGVPKSSLQRYASGETKKIPVDAIEKVAPFLGVSAASIIGWESETSSESGNKTVDFRQEQALNKEEAELVQNYQSVSAPRKAELLNFSRYLTVQEKEDENKVIGYAVAEDGVSYQNTPSKEGLERAQKRYLEVLEEDMKNLL